MDKIAFIQDVSVLVDKYCLDRQAGVKAGALAEYIYSCVETLAKVNGVRSGDTETDEFIERMYALYPTKCPKRNTSLGKSYKDKDRLRKLLKRYSFEEIERVIRHEIDSKYGQAYMQNFSTFLNNFPDPGTVGMEDFPSADGRDGVLIIDGQEYR